MDQQGKMPNRLSDTPEIRDIVVTQKAGEGEVNAQQVTSDVTDENTVDRIASFITLLADMANKEHVLLNVDSDTNKIKPACQNNITRLITNECAFYPKGKPLTVELYDALFRKIIEIAQRCHENLHLVLASIPLLTPDQEIHNIIIHLQCGEKPIAHCFAKFIPERIRKAYADSATMHVSEAAIMPKLLMPVPNNNSYFVQIESKIIKFFNKINDDNFSEMAKQIVSWLKHLKAQLNQIQDPHYQPPDTLLQVVTLLIAKVNQAKNALAVGACLQEMMMFYDEMHFYHHSSWQNFRQLIQSEKNKIFTLKNVGSVDQTITYDPVVLCRTAAGFPFYTYTGVCLGHANAIFEYYQIQKLGKGKAANTLLVNREKMQINLDRFDPTILGKTKILPHADENYLEIENPCFGTNCDVHLFSAKPLAPLPFDFGDRTSKDTYTIEYYTRKIDTILKTLFLSDRAVEQKKYLSELSKSVVALKNDKHAKSRDLYNLIEDFRSKIDLIRGEETDKLEEQILLMEQYLDIKVLPPTSFIILRVINPILKMLPERQYLIINKFKLEVAGLARLDFAQSEYASLLAHTIFEYKEIVYGIITEDTSMMKVAYAQIELYLKKQYPVVYTELDILNQQSGHVIQNNTAISTKGEKSSLQKKKAWISVGKENEEELVKDAYLSEKLQVVLASNISPAQRQAILDLAKALNHFFNKVKNVSEDVNIVEHVALLAKDLVQFKHQIMQSPLAKFPTLYHEIELNLKRRYPRLPGQLLLANADNQIMVASTQLKNDLEAAEKEYKLLKAEVKMTKMSIQNDKKNIKLQIKELMDLHEALKDQKTVAIEETDSVQDEVDRVDALDAEISKVSDALAQSIQDLDGVLESSKAKLITLVKNISELQVQRKAEQKLFYEQQMSHAAKSVSVKKSTGEDSTALLEKIKISEAEVKHLEQSVNKKEAKIKDLEEKMDAADKKLRQLQDQQAKQDESTRQDKPLGNMDDQLFDLEAEFENIKKQQKEDGE